MLRVFLLLFFGCSLMGAAQTQSEMNQAAFEEYQKSDEQLNHLYQTILQEYAADTVFIRNLKEAQRLWIRFRDAEVKMKYPAEDSRVTYGSFHPVCRANYLKELTDQRIHTLQQWVVGIQEGDLCAGSVQIRRQNQE